MVHSYDTPQTSELILNDMGKSTKTTARNVCGYNSWGILQMQHVKGYRIIDSVLIVIECDPNSYLCIGTINTNTSPIMCMTITEPKWWLVILQDCHINYIHRRVEFVQMKIVHHDNTNYVSGFANTEQKYIHVAMKNQRLEIMTWQIMVSTFVSKFYFCFPLSLWFLWDKKMMKETQVFIHIYIYINLSNADMTASICKENHC